MMLGPAPDWAARSANEIMSAAAVGMVMHNSNGPSEW